MLRNPALLSSFSQLEPIHISHRDLFAQAMLEEPHQSWCYYFPFLYFFSQLKGRTIVTGKIHHSQCWFLLREARDKAPRLSLYFPPMPFCKVALKQALSLVQEFNHSRRANILWIDAADKDNFLDFKGLKFEPREDEYLYRPSEYASLAGGRFRKLRQNLRKVTALEQGQAIESRDYEKHDAKACLDLLQRWQQSQGNKVEGRADSSYVKSCLKSAHLFNKKELFGRVFIQQGQICSFGFAGEMHSSLANLFIGKSNHHIEGLNYHMQMSLIKDLGHYPLLNNSSDMGHEGLRFAKQHLCPVAMHGVYKARYSGYL